MTMPGRPVELAEAVIEALEAGDEQTLTALLHPYLHWTEGGTSIRGRIRVLAGPPPEPPASVELRDGQIYRWRG